MNRSTRAHIESASAPVADAVAQGVGDVPSGSARVDFDSLPTLYRDRAFWGMTITQLLGAFNDSVFKQIVLLLCLSVVVQGTAPSDQQFLAQAIFALAFVLFSGIAGYWSDRVTKRSLIVACKVGEILVMSAATLTFLVMSVPASVTKVTLINASRIESMVYVLYGTPWLLLGVLFFMGLQSAIFGPAKYGILPEMVRGRDLPRFNGVIQMTTFLSLIFGIWLGGFLLDRFHADLWKAGAVCVLIAMVGTASSLLVRRTPIAEPDAPLQPSALFAGAETWRLLAADRSLSLALMVYSAFWFVAALLPMAINWLGVYQFRLNYTNTSLLLATSSVGIALGFVLAGWLSAKRIRFGLVRLGTWGLIVCLVLMSLPSAFSSPPAEEAASTAIDQAKRAPHMADLARSSSSVAGANNVITERLTGSSWPHLLGYRGSQVVLALIGFFAGLFALPVQVFLQSKPPDHLKGRVIGSMNLINWIAIILAAAFYFGADYVLGQLGLPKFFSFGLAALALFPVALFYRPRDQAL